MRGFRIILHMAKKVYERVYDSFTYGKKGLLYVALSSTLLGFSILRIFFTVHFFESKHTMSGRKFVLI